MRDREAGSYLGAMTLLVSSYAIVGCVGAYAQGTQSYQAPPASIMQMVDAPRVPAAHGSASPRGRWILVDEFGPLPSSQDLASPTLTLAPWRVDPKTNAAFGVLTFGLFKHTAVYDGASGRLREFEPKLVAAGGALWSPDGRRFAFLRPGEPGIQLWLGDPERAEVRQVPGVSLNGTRVMATVPVEPPCEWSADSRRLLCLTVPEGRGPPPSNQTSAALTIRDTQGADSDLSFRPKYETFLRNAHDEVLYDYYMTAQPLMIDVSTGETTKIGGLGIYKTLVPSPDGRYLLAIRIQKPYSYETYDDQFPSVVEILESNGRSVHVIARTSLDTSGFSIAGNASQGPRQFFWQPTAPSTLAYYQALDDGVAKQPANYRDSLRLMRAPFDKPSIEIFRSKKRLGSWPVRSLWGRDGVLILEEWDWEAQRRLAWKLNSQLPGHAPELLWSYQWKDGESSDELVTALSSATGREWKTESLLQDGVLLQKGDWVYLRGVEKTSSAERPFLDRFNLTTHKKDRVFQSSADAYEEVVSVLDSRAQRLLLTVQSESVPPNLNVIDLNTHARVALTHYTDPFPDLAHAERRTIHYARADGLPLTGRLYLPTNYRLGDKPPVILYGYPMLNGAHRIEPQPRNKFRSTSLNGESPLPLVTQGYAVFVADMQLKGGKEADDTNNEQLAADAKAAIDTLVNLGIADPSRIGIVGHSYGGFMVANLLENTDLFAAGVAISGLYNLTLTPTRLMYDEDRSYWQAPEVWDRMSPFRHADRINAPLLLLHGERDGSSGATANQSIGMFEALESLGRTSRLVIFPNEGHVLRGREAMLHAQWEMLAWFDRYLKSPAAADVAHAQRQPN